MDKIGAQCKMGPVERSSSSGHVELCAVYTLVVFLQFLPKQLGKLCRSRVKSQTHLKAAHSIQCYTARVKSQTHLKAAHSIQCYTG